MPGGLLFYCKNILNVLIFESQIGNENLDRVKHRNPSFGVDFCCPINHTYESPDVLPCLQTLENTLFLSDF